MSDVIVLESLEAFQLKECYELAAQFERFAPAKEVLRQKSKKIDVSMNCAPVQEEASYPESDMQTLSEALYQLTIGGPAATEICSHMLSKLRSASAEAEFLRALLSLSKGTGETQRLDALKHISIALSYSRNDPRFIVLADVLQEAGNR